MTGPVDLDKRMQEVAALTVEIAKWENSQETLPLVEELRHRTLEERAEDFGGNLGPYTEFDWGEPVGREML